MNPVLPTTNPQNVGTKNPASTVRQHLGGVFIGVKKCTCILS